MANEFYDLKVISVENPTESSTMVSLEVPKSLKKHFQFYPGQHLVLKFKIEGKEIRRSYSLNSNPYVDEHLSITVKRVKEGLISNYIGDNINTDDILNVMVPQGLFYADVKEHDYKTYFLFAAGSGITPIISILKAVLAVSPRSVVNLIYGNSNQDSIIFKEELDELQKQYSQRLQIVHSLTNPKVWTQWKQWNGRKGRIDTQTVEWFISQYPPMAQSTEYYVCGPGVMNTNVRDTLVNLGIPKSLIHIEQFGADETQLTSKIKVFDNAELIVSINENTHQLIVPSGKTILETMKDANINPPYSCESGICATCMATIEKGKAEMKSCMALDEDEIGQGKILTCQAFPTSEKVEINFN